MTSPQQRFAHLTWLAVWYKPSEVTGASACTEKQEGADDGEAFPRDGLLLFQDVDEKATEESKRKRFGLAQGLIDFVRMLAQKSTLVRSVQSSNGRLLFLQPVPYVYLVAHVSLPWLTSSTKGAHPTDETLDDDLLLSSLQQSFDLYQLLNGSLTLLIQQRRWTQVTNSLEAFYSRWIKRWDTEGNTLGGFDVTKHLSALNTRPASHMDQTGQSLQQFSSRHQECTACLFEATQIVAQSGASCSPSSLATLIQHLEPALPDKTSSVQQPDRRYTDSSNNGTWKNTLGVTQLGNYLTLSSLTPNVASLQSSVSDVPADTLDGTRKGKEKQRSASTSWAPSWDTLTKPFHISGMSTKYSTSDGAQKRCSVSLSQSYRAGQDDDSDSDESVAEHISSLAEKRAPQEDQLSEADTSSARIEDPAQSSSAAIDNDAISEALSSELAIDCVESSEASLVSLAETLRFFDAEQNRWQLAYRFSINQVTLLVVDADRTEGSEGLVRDAKATLSRLDVAHTPAPLSQYRYLILYPGHNITHSSGWPTRDERWSGSLANSKEADAAGALLQGRKLINGNLGISHTMIRTGTNQWSVLKRGEQDQQEYFMVLPRKFGKEGSLVDAGAELEKLETAATSYPL